MLHALTKYAGVSDPFFSNVVSLNHFEGGFTYPTPFTDQIVGRNPWTITGNISSNTGKFGNGALFSDSLGTLQQCATTPSSTDFDFGSGDFTIEIWVYYTPNGNGNKGLVVRDNIGATRGWLLYLSDNTGILGAASFYAFVGATAYGMSDTISLPSATWTFLSVVRDVNTLRLYKNGVQVASVTISGSVNSSGTPLVLGNLWSAGAVSTNSGFFGRMDDERITKGVCRYPGGTTFSVPTAPFPNH